MLWTEKIQYRPRIRLILLVSNLTLLTLPFLLVIYLRYFENELVQRVETMLASHGALVAVYHRTALPRMTPDERESWLKSYPKAKSTVEDEPGVAFFGTGPPTLDLRSSLRHPRLAWEMQSCPDEKNRNTHPYTITASKSLHPYLPALENATAGGLEIRVVDINGFVVSHTLDCTVMTISLAEHDNLQQAFKGEVVRSLHLSGKVPPSHWFTRIIHSLGLSHVGTVSVVVTFPVILHKRVIAAVVLTKSPGTMLDGIKNNLGWMFGLVFLLLAAGTLFSLFIALTITRPVAAVVDRMERLIDGERGAIRFSKRMVTREMEHLSRAISRTVDVLEGREEQADANARRADANASRADAMARHVAHETRTPLTSTTLAVDLLRKQWETMSPKDRDQFLSMIEKNSARLLSMSEKLMKETRAGSVRVQEEDRASLEDVLQELEADNDTRKLVVTLNPRAQGKFVAMDKEWLYSILTSLIDNAYQHGGRDVDVAVTCDIDPNSDDSIQIQVHNTGQQISDETADQLFDPFFTTTPGKGTGGLGLSIVRDLVKTHNGTIELIDSNSGTTFQVVLPAR